MVTPIGESNLMPIGFDAPFTLHEVDNGTALITSVRGVGTLWIDPSPPNDSNAQKIQQLIKNGWELGIHFSKGLSTLSMADAIELMNTEYNLVLSEYGQAPTSWCSLENDDNSTHAAYAYTHLGMVWRNGYHGVHAVGNIGNIDDSTWAWWENASKSGSFIPAFTHKTDLQPAPAYSIDYSIWKELVYNYVNAGVNFTSYYNYWCMAQNTYATSVSNISRVGSTLSFDMTNIGGNSRMLLNGIGSNSMVIGPDGKGISYIHTDDGLIVVGPAGKYSIQEMIASSM